MIARLALLLPLALACRAGGPAEPLFVDRAEELGLSFRHENGMSGRLYFSEMAGSGLALLDYDRDGDLDLYLVQGGPLEAVSPGGAGATDRLFRNELEATPEGPRPAFVDITEESGIEGGCYGMGAAVGDADSDGWPDLYVTCFGRNHLWRNRGDGTFVDVVDEAGADDERWNSSAAFVDVDRDGRHDLYLVAYTDFALASHRPCVSDGGAPDYCGPLTYRPLSDRLLLGRGTPGRPRFLDVSERVGLAAVPGPGLGVLVLDADSDGWQDLYVANDQAPNQLWMVRGLDAEGLPRLVEDALLRGVAVDALGSSQASMGVAAGDVDADGDPDLFLTHLVGETNTLYRNDGRGLFSEGTAAAGLAAASLPMTGFGTAMLDVDNDGWLDLVAANGEVRVIEAQRRAGLAPPLRQPNQLFRNEGGTFRDWTSAVPALGRSEVSRGLAVGDLDNDGDPDLVISNNHGPLEVLINQVGARAPWLGLELVDRLGRPALGAEARLHREGLPVLLRTVRRASSYLSSSDPRLLFGLGGGAEIDRIEVLWPGGERQTLRDLAPGRYHTLVQPAGEAP